MTKTGGHTGLKEHQDDINSQSLALQCLRNLPHKFSKIGRRATDWFQLLVCVLPENAHLVQCSRCQIFHQRKRSHIMHTTTMFFLIIAIIWLSYSSKLLTSIFVPVLKWVIISLFKSVCSCFCHSVIILSVCIATFMKLYDTNDCQLLCDLYFTMLTWLFTSLIGSFDQPSIICVGQSELWLNKDSKVCVVYQGWAKQWHTQVVAKGGCNQGCTSRISCLKKE